jgi:hypothetical protein
MADLYANLIKAAYLTPLIQAFLPPCLLFHRVLGIIGITWVKARLRAAVESR